MDLMWTYTLCKKPDIILLFLYLPQLYSALLYDQLVYLTNFEAIENGGGSFTKFIGAT